jgi:hypothetical protein
VQPAHFEHTSTGPGISLGGDPTSVQDEDAMRGKIAIVKAAPAPLRCPKSMAPALMPRLNKIVVQFVSYRTLILVTRALDFARQLGDGRAAK